MEKLFTSVGKRKLDERKYIYRNFKWGNFESEESILLDQSTLWTLNYKSISDPFEKRKNTRLQNPNININSLRNKFVLLAQMVHNNLDMLLIF